MNRWVFSLVLLMLCSFQTAQRVWGELKGTRPNIILIMTDDQGYGPIGRHGHPWIKTPALDHLHDTSVRFSRFLVCPTCSPTRSAVLTGRHSMRNGITHTILERERMALDAKTLPAALQLAGYRTGIFGKWHLGDEDEYQPQKRGFNEAFIHGAGGIGQSYACSCGDVPKNSYFNPVIRHNGGFVQTNGFCTDVFFDAAGDWIRKQKSSPEPFFAMITTNAPHGPYLAPESYKERFLNAGFSQDQAGYYGMIENIDTNVGTLLKRLDQWQLLKSTVIVFMSDNGMTGGASGPPGKPLGHDPDGRPMTMFNAGMKGLKGSPDEGGVRVPFFVRWDGKIPAGRDIDRIAAHIDIFPTLATLANAPLPEGQIEGRNLLPLIEDPKSDWPDRLLFTHVGRWETGEEPNDYQWKRFSVRSQKYRWVNGQELFDMEADPGQTENVANKHPEIVEQMRTAYSAWWKTTRTMMVNEDVPMSAVQPFAAAFLSQKEQAGIPDWPSPKFED